MGLKGKIFKCMSDISKDASYYKLYAQAKSTSVCGLPKGFFTSCSGFRIMATARFVEERYRSSVQSYDRFSPYTNWIRFEIFKLCKESY